ncbi:MAG: ribonuclease H-like domain-containing protein [Anaeromyxobacteraceae bacterium]
MLQRTFQLTQGIGPWRERQLWSQGIATWDDLEARRGAAASRLDSRLLEAVGRARTALEARDAGALAAMMPSRERWRLFPTFADDAAFLDIETDGGDTVTAVAVLDRDGPRVFVRGRDLEEFPTASRGWKLLVTYNGLSFDVPVLRRAFPGWRPPPAHVDLRHLWGRLGHRGGLKLLEEAQGILRPPHLSGLGGWDAVVLWRRHLDGDPGALRLLVEYNLHDAVNLQALAALGYNRIVERLGLPAEPLRVAHRGDWLLDMTRQLLALG